MRPFLKEFMAACLKRYSVQFYTAANSAYAVKILEILKLEISQVSGIDPKLVDSTFQESRLITRDDKHQFGDNKNSQVEMEMM